MTSDQKETAIASHVEALVQLGWRWEGRGLIPTIQNSHGNVANASSTVDSSQQEHI